MLGAADAVIAGYLGTRTEAVGGGDRGAPAQYADATRSLERAAGRCGELVLRRRRRGHEVISDGSFLISDENEVSSRRPDRGGASAAPRRQLDVCIGGLGLGYALDEALD